MDRISSFRPAERPRDPNTHSPSPATYPHAFQPPTAHPPVQFPFSDPFQAKRDPFLFGAHHRNESNGPPRAWQSSQGHMLPNGHAHRTPPPQPQSHPLPPPPPTNGVGAMSLPYDPSRRRSVDAAGSPPQHPQGPNDQPLPPPPFQSRHMPPPSPPQVSSSAPSLPGSAPRGPPTASPFAGVRDLASYSSNRPSGGMSISSILGGNEERKSHGSPLSSTPKSMPPPSPGRVRSSSMREGQARNARDVSPPRNTFAEAKATPTGHGHDRTISEPQREGFLSSPRFVREPFNNFRAFQPAPQDVRPGLNGHGPPGRPNSQPVEPAAPRTVDEIIRHAHPPDGRLGAFRSFGEPSGSAIQDEATQRRLLGMPPNGDVPRPQAVERSLFPSPLVDREHQQAGPTRFQLGVFNTPRAEEQASLFRPAFQPASEPARESIEARQYHDGQRDLTRSSPPPSEFPPFDRGRNGFVNGPLGLEDYQREMMQREAMHRERMQREQQQRKESDGSLHRALFNISPEVNRKGRNSPLPQAVQGAQPRHVGPGGDNPSVKMEFGRMFSGLGSGVGTATPNAGNGTTTPSRMTPIRQVEGGDLVRTAVAEIEEGRRSSKADSRGGRKSSRRFREEEERMNGRETPDHQSGSKRAKTNHHHHHHVHPHHHHHHHQSVESTMPNPFNTIRFQSNPLSNSNVVANNNSAHHHHHHHATHAHPGHHHHHPAARPPPSVRKPSITVTSQTVLESCAKRPRKHLGSQLYSTGLSMPPAIDTTSFDASQRLKFASTMKPIPFFEGKENCTFTVRVPREFLAMGSTGDGDASYLEEICKRRQLWGSEIYTDDSDVIAAAVHDGWLKGDFGEFNEDLRLLCGNDSEQEDASTEVQDVPLTLESRPKRPVRVPNGHDAHVTLLILPPLEKYASSHQHHMLSRSWSGRGVGHDGMSFMISRIEFVDEGWQTRMFERNAAGRKLRLAFEEKQRKEAARSLVLFAGGPGGGQSVGGQGVEVGA